MQRNLLFLQQQALARQAQQQRLAALQGQDNLNVNNNSWLPQQSPQSSQQRQETSLSVNTQQLPDDAAFKQQKIQQQKLASMYLQQRSALSQPQSQPQVQSHVQPQVQSQQHQPKQFPQQTVSTQSIPIAPTQALPSQQSTPMQIQPSLPTGRNAPNAIVVKNPEQEKNLNTYINRDKKYQVILDIQHRRHMKLAQEKKVEIDIANNERRLRAQHRGILTFGKGYDGWGNGRTGMGNAKIIYPADKKRKRNYQTLRHPHESSIEQAHKEETLVAIRLDLENEGYKIRDTFTWNMNESTITPEQFAEVTCEDLRLPVSVFVPLIASSIKEQVQDYFLNASSMLIDSQESPEVDTYDEFMKCKKQKIQIEDIKMIKVEGDDEYNRIECDRKAELRTLIKLDIIVGNKILRDQFEWDITCKKNSPESFAQTMATELGLGGEFKTAIAHSIREQVHVYIKSLLLTGYEFGEGTIENEELKRCFLPSLSSIIRDNHYVEKFTPTIIEVSDMEIAKIEKGRTRESRRKRRGIRNRKGTALPDREPIPTYRTVFASPPEQELTDEQFFKSMQNIPDTSSILHSQRKSAMKARMNIAAEAAGLSLTSGHLMSSMDEGPMVQRPMPSNADLATRPIPSKFTL
ncbi:hypothetical protein BDB01DRAFT_776042 [Pilobolus umbonatus]|nr:hypothetical protein BDB01DRAFT_776042 [Pilobolus umbonatus]